MTLKFKHVMLTIIIIIYNELNMSYTPYIYIIFYYLTSTNTVQIVEYGCIYYGDNNICIYYGDIIYVLYIRIIHTYTMCIVHGSRSIKNYYSGMIP